MNIYVINKSTVLTDQEIQSWMPAFNKFVQHVRRFWPRPATLVWCDRSQEPAVAWKLIFADTSDEAGALGYHDFTPDGRPISYVFAADDLKYGYNTTVTATHEIAEMIADPWISEAFQVNNTDFYAKEVCDPVEKDIFGYDIITPGFPDVIVSDFITPNWFIPGSSSVYDFKGHITQPLQILDGGYMSVFKSGSGWTTLRKAGEEIVEEIKEKGGYGRLERYGRNRGSLTAN